MKNYSKSRGFTIVELLIVIVIIGILAALIIVSYNGLQQRANYAKQDADSAQLVKAITVARESAGVKPLKDITGSTWSSGGCEGSPGNNTELKEPKDLPKTHACWTKYYNMLSTIATASGTNLNGLKDGDARGNPYTIDENEGENSANPCNRDVLRNFAGSGTAYRKSITISNILPGC